VSSYTAELIQTSKPLLISKIIQHQECRRGTGKTTTTVTSGRRWNQSVASLEILLMTLSCE